MKQGVMQELDVKFTNHNNCHHKVFKNEIKETRSTESSLFRLQLTRYDVATLVCAHTLGG